MTSPSQGEDTGSNPVGTTTLSSQNGTRTARKGAVWSFGHGFGHEVDGRQNGDTTTPRMRPVSAPTTPDSSVGAFKEVTMSPTPTRVPMGTALEEAQERIHTCGRILHQLWQHIVIAPEDAGIGVAHDAGRDGIRLVDDSGSVAHRRQRFGSTGNSRLASVGRTGKPGTGSASCSAGRARSWRSRLSRAGLCSSLAVPDGDQGRR